MKSKSSLKAGYLVKLIGHDDSTTVTPLGTLGKIIIKHPWCCLVRFDNGDQLLIKDEDLELISK